MAECVGEDEEKRRGGVNKEENVMEEERWKQRKVRRRGEKCDLFKLAEQNRKNK